MSTKTTGQKINELASGKFLKLGKVAPAGSLEVRKLSSGAVVLYWRVTINGKTAREMIGMYDPSAPPKALQPTSKGYSVMAAMRAAEALAAQHHANLELGGYAGVKAAAADAKAQEEMTRREAAQHTLECLLGDYADHLEALGRRSHKDVRSIIKLHIIEPWPKVAALPANKVTGEQIADLMRRVIELGKDRTANKLRSYVRAAYQTAKAARSKASIPVRFKAYRITHNPGADTEPDESANRADKNPLSAEELRAYWHAIKTLPGVRGAALRLHLLTGGQRIEQLVTLRTSDVRGDSVTLFDGKGRPGKPARPHTVPLIPMAAAALLECRPQGIYAISTSGGDTHMSAITLSRWAVLAGAAIPDFQTKRIRSGVETLLASARISADIRGRLQSHGISGVQARHYDGHHYMPEKLQALETLFRLLDAPEVGNVVQFKAA